MRCHRRLHRFPGLPLPPPMARRLTVALLLTLGLLAAGPALPAGAQGQAPGASQADPGQALDRLRAAAERGPLPLEAALALARGEAAAGDRGAAKAVLADAARRFDSVRARMMLAQLQAGAGGEAGDEAAALETVRRALEDAPNSEEVVSVYARLSLATGAPAQALRALEALVRMHPEVAEHRYLLGVALMQLADLQRAREVLEEAIRLDPGQPMAHVARGLLMNELDRYAEARESLEAALRLAPDDLDALAALAEAEEGLGDLAAAERHARRVLARAPGHPTAHLALGLVRMEERRYAEARDALLASLAAEPDSAKAHYQLSLAYARLGERERSAHHAQLSSQAKRRGEEQLQRMRGVSPEKTAPEETPPSYDPPDPETEDEP